MVAPMKANLREIHDFLGVPETLEPYGSWPWSAYDTANSTTCNAEVRMDETGKHMEAEILLIRDVPLPGVPMVDQVMYMSIELSSMNNKWMPNLLRVRKELMSGKIYDWETKGCQFFVAVAGALARGEVPDIDELIEKILKAADATGSGTARGGSRKPTIRPEQLLDPTKKF